MAPPFAVDVAMLPITVAALMTTEWIAKHLEVPAGTDLVLIPGLCEGDTASIANRFDVHVEKGPKDLREIPEYFGHAGAREEYGAWDIEIIAEINNAPRLSRDAITREAMRFRDSGADYIDIGCTPGLAFPELGAVVRDLVAAGMHVSIDTFDAAEIRTAVDASATMVLSVNGSNLDIARELSGRNVRVVAIPDLGAPLESINPILDALAKWSVPFLIDPVIEPIGFGFTRSIERYAEARRRWPDAEMMMGIGNITELTAADSTGVNAILVAICQELGIRAVLTTEVIPWARGSVREIDIARRLMYHAVTKHVVPKRIDDRLVTVKDPKILEYGELLLAVLEDLRILDRDKTVVDTLGDHVLRDRVIHEAARDVDLAHGASRPRDDLRREHGSDAELLTDRDENGVDAGGVSGGELGDVADSHHHLGVGPATARFCVALDRAREAEADGLDHGIDEKRHAPLRKRIEYGVDALERRAQVGDGDDANVAAGELARDVEVAPIHAQHHRGARVYRRANLGGVERIDAHVHTGGDEVAHHGAQLRERQAGGATDVDVVRARVAKAHGLACDRVAGKSGRVVDLGDDLDVPRAVLLARASVAKVFRDLAQILRALLDVHVETVRDGCRVTLAKTRNQNEVGARRDLEMLRNPLGGHERRDGDRQHRDIYRERWCHRAERAAERRLGELTGYEENA